jgi:hypothetical protein
MQTCKLTYHLLEKFEIATPGVSPARLELSGYSSEDIQEKLEMLHSNGLTNVIAARDKLGKPYTGMIIGLTQAGSELLERSRRSQLHKNPTV